MGLKFQYLPEAVYDRGRSSSNRFEAKKVVEAAMDHYRRFGWSKSLGIGTFNIKQQHGIDVSPIGYITSFPVEIVSPDIVVIVESSYENVLKRRQSDKSKNRVLEDFKDLNEHMVVPMR